MTIKPALGKSQLLVNDSVSFAYQTVGYEVVTQLFQIGRARWMVVQRLLIEGEQNERNFAIKSDKHEAEVLFDSAVSEANDIAFECILRN